MHENFQKTIIIPQKADNYSSTDWRKLLYGNSVVHSNWVDTSLSDHIQLSP